MQLTEADLCMLRLCTGITTDIIVAIFNNRYELSSGNVLTRNRGRAALLDALHYNVKVEGQFEDTVIYAKNTRNEVCRVRSLIALFEKRIYANN